MLNLIQSGTETKFGGLWYGETATGILTGGYIWKGLKELSVFFLLCISNLIPPASDSFTRSVWPKQWQWLCVKGWFHNPWQQRLHPGMDSDAAWEVLWGEQSWQMCWACHYQVQHFAGSSILWMPPNHSSKYVLRCMRRKQLLRRWSMRDYIILCPPLQNTRDLCRLEISRFLW